MILFDFFYSIRDRSHHSGLPRTKMHTPIRRIRSSLVVLCYFPSCPGEVSKSWSEATCKDMVRSGCLATRRTLEAAAKIGCRSCKLCFIAARRKKDPFVHQSSSLQHGVGGFNPPLNWNHCCTATQSLLNTQQRHTKHLQ